MLVIRLQHPDDIEPAWALFKTNTTADWAHGEWSQVLPLTAGQQVVVLIPSRDVLLSQTSINAQNQKQLKQALPYALEDGLIQDLETQHIAWQVQAQSSQVNVAVIAQARLREWRAACLARQIRPYAILPDVFALPWTQGSVTLWQQGDAIWLRTGELSGYAATPSSLALMLYSLIDGRTEPLPLRLYMEQEHTLADDARFVIEPETQAETLSLSSIQPCLGLNLLKGLQDENRAQLKQHWQRWKLVASLAVITALLGLAFVGLDVYRLKQDLAQLDTQNLQLYQELFPDSPAPDARELKSRVDSDLMRVNNGATGGANSPLVSMAHFATAMQGIPNLKIMEMNASAGILTIKVQTQEQQAIETLRANLEQNPAIPVSIQSSNEAGQVEATINLGATS
jgi:type II secretion system protein L